MPYGFTQDPYGMGDEQGMRAQDALLGVTRRFGLRRRPRFTGRGREPGPENRYGLIPPPFELPASESGEAVPMSTTRTSEDAPVQPPRFPAFGKYKEALGQQPEYQEPGKGRRALAAVLAGLSEFGRPGTGQQTGERVLHGRYQQEMGRWERQTEAARRAADLEAQEFEMGQAATREERAGTAEKRVAEKHTQEMQESKADKLIGQYSARGGKQRFIFQRVDGSTYEKESEAEVGAKPDYASAEKTVVVGNRVKQFNPQTGRYDIDVGPAPADKGGQADARQQGRQRVAITQKKNSRLSQLEADYRRRIDRLDDALQKIEVDEQQYQEEKQRIDDEMLANKQTIENDFIAEIDSAGMEAGAPFNYYEQARAPKAGTGKGKEGAKGKVLTKDVAREYLRKAGGDKGKARQLAKADGYSIE